MDKILFRIEKRVEEKKRFRIFLSTWKDLWFEGGYNNDGFDLKTITKNVYTVKGIFTDNEIDNNIKVEFQIQESRLSKFGRGIQYFFLTGFFSLTFLKTNQYQYLAIYLALLIILVSSSFFWKRYYQNKIRDILKKIMKLKNIE